MAVDANKVEDKRFFERFPASYPARVKGTLDQFGDNVYLRDASAQGAHISARGPFYFNDNVTVEVDLMDGKDPMTIRGKVVWAKPSSNEYWDIGLKFHEISLMNMSRVYGQFMSST